MTMTERMDEILSSHLYDLYCPICNTRDHMMWPDSMASDTSAFCRECGTGIPMNKREEPWN